jgi:hypothetical protein
MGRGDYTIHQRALDATLNASDGTNVINYTIWTYCVDKSVHQHRNQTTEARAGC